jgi:hypothetical protein
MITNDKQRALCGSQPVAICSQKSTNFAKSSPVAWIPGLLAWRRTFCSAAPAEPWGEQGRTGILGASTYSNTWDCLLPKPCETMEVWLPKAFQHLGLSMVEESARASTCVNIIISLRIDDLVVFFTSS